jgi:hypothetical protein
MPAGTALGLTLWTWQENPALLEGCLLSSSLTSLSMQGMHESLSLLVVRAHFQTQRYAMSCGRRAAIRLRSWNMHTLHILKGRVKGCDSTGCSTGRPASLGLGLIIDRRVVCHI